MSKWAKASSFISWPKARTSELDPNVAVMNATLGALGSGNQWVWEPSRNVADLRSQVDILGI